MRNHIPNKCKYPEKYSYLLFLFLLQWRSLLLYPFYNQSEYSNSYRGSCSNKFNKHGVLQVIKYDKAIIEPHSDLLEHLHILEIRLVITWTRSTERGATSYINFKQYRYFKLQQGKVTKSYKKLLKKIMIIKKSRRTVTSHHNLAYGNK